MRAGSVDFSEPRAGRFPNEGSSAANNLNTEEKPMTTNSTWTSVIACTAVAMLLSGCSRSISIVKDSDAPNPSYKIGQLLDHKANCASSSWSSGKDNYDRPTVEFRCEVHIPAEMTEKMEATLLQEVNRRFDERFKKGPYVPGLTGEGDQYPVSQYRIDLSFNNSVYRTDPATAAQLDEAKKKYDQAIADLASVDSQCISTLKGQQADIASSVQHYFSDHNSITEVLTFSLKDNSVAGVTVTTQYKDGSNAARAIVPSALYNYMLDPASQQSEEAHLLSASFMPRIDVGDLKYCGHVERYQRFAARINEVKSDIDAAGNSYQSHRGS